MRLIRLAILLAALVPAPARAEVRAILVGVGDYLHIDADLRGPPADVALMARTLIARGVAPDAILALTTGAPDLPPGVRTGLPERAAILAALQTPGTAPGDTLVFYFSGHGSQAPDRDGDEVSGMDQILLPMDARGWNGAAGEVEGAIRDDELQAHARALLSAGVQVVGIIDACHSGTGFRAAGGRGVARVVAPEALGIPEEADPAPAADPAGAPAPLPGDFVFLYAAQADQRSFEYPLDPADPAGRWQGGFTLAVAQALSRHDGLTWRQALRLARDDLAAAAQRQDPDGEGPLLDAPVFGRTAGGLRLPVSGGQLAAGLLDGLAAGSRVALFADPQGGEALAEARVIEPGAAASRLDPPPPAAAAWAEVIAPAPPPPLRLGAPVRADPADGADYGAWEAALAAAVQAGLAEAAPPQGADLVPILTGGGVALAGADGVLDPAGAGSSPRVLPRDGETVAEAMARTIETAAHAQRLRTVLTRLAGRGPGALGRIEVAVEHRPGSAQGSACRRGEALSPLDPAAGAAPCDDLFVTLRNATGKAQDVTLFWVGQDFTVTPVWPARGTSSRLPLGGTARAGLRITADTPAPGLEELWVVAVAADLRADSAPLAALATPDRLRTTGADPTLAAVDALLDPEAGTSARAFTAARPPLILIRQPLRIVPR